jgi:hypothetical protein
MVPNSSQEVHMYREGQKMSSACIFFGLNLFKLEGRLPEMWHKVKRLRKFYKSAKPEQF